MNEAEAKNIKDPRTIPWNEPCFIFAPERYYLGMYSIKIPKGKEYPLGGDITAQCWRFDSTPSEWVLTLRFRYYNSDKIWESGDRKSWYAYRIKTDETGMEEIMKQYGTLISGATGLYFLAGCPDIQSVAFKGDGEKALEILQNNPPAWMHMKKA